MDKHLDLIFKGLQSTDSASNEDTDSFCVCGCDFETSIFNRIKSCRNTEMDETVHPATLFALDPIGYIKPFDFSRNLDIKACWIKMCNSPDSGDSGNK